MASGRAAQANPRELSSQQLILSTGPGGTLGIMKDLRLVRISAQLGQTLTVLRFGRRVEDRSQVAFHAEPGGIITWSSWP